MSDKIIVKKPKKTLTKINLINFIKTLDKPMLI